jgi:hypothetical protein
VPAGEGEGPCRGRRRIASLLACWCAPGWRSVGGLWRPPGGTGHVPVLRGFVRLFVGFFDPGLPDADLVLGLSVTDEVGADPPIVVFQGRPEDDVVHVVVAGEGGSEPDGHLGQREVGLLVVSGGVEVVDEEGESLSLGPFCMRVSSLDEPNELGLHLVPVVVGDVEPGCLSGVLFESNRAHASVLWQVVGVGAAAALAAV